MERVRRQLHDDGGFSLVELLVVVVILGVLAGIAIPVLISQRQKGMDGAVKSDLRNGVTAQVTYRMMESNDRYAQTQEEMQEAVKFGPSIGVIFADIRIDGGERFCLEAYHEGSTNRRWFFDSDDPHPQLAETSDPCSHVPSSS